MASQEIETLTQALARLPGLGPRSARRAVLWLIKRRETSLVQLLGALEAVREGLVECRTCGNVDTTDPCGICTDPRRDQRSLCVVEDIADLWALDRARLFTGRYHVLGGRLSALEGIELEALSLGLLLERFTFDPCALTAPATANAVGVNIIAQQMQVRAFNAITAGAALGDHIIESLGLATQAAAAVNQ